MNHPPPLPPARIMREKRTVAAMVDIYCRAPHGSSGPVRQVRQAPGLRLLPARSLSVRREKTPCARCQVQCYGATMRTHIKEVMRYAGPRMLFRHPILALLHQWDNFRHKALR